MPIILSSVGWQLRNNQFALLRPVVNNTVRETLPTNTFPCIIKCTNYFASENKLFFLEFCTYQKFLWHFNCIITFSNLLLCFGTNLTCQCFYFRTICKFFIYIEKKNSFFQIINRIWLRERSIIVTDKRSPKILLKYCKLILLYKWSSDLFLRGISLKKLEIK